MKILVLTTAYPNKNDYYQNAFVHNRLTEYKNIDSSLLIDVMVIQKRNTQEFYKHESINVYKGNIDSLSNVFKGKNYDRILVHFLDYKIIDFIDSNNIKDPLLVWVHGAEALSWKRRLFNIRNKGFFKEVVKNLLQLKKLKSFVLKNESRITFIFVSEWMKQVMEEDVSVNIKNYYIIPNNINIDFYKYFKKDEGLNKNILLIRPFNSNKYANDVAVSSILGLSKKYKRFKELNFTIIGKGPLFKIITDPIKDFKNVTLINSFLSKDDIKKYHDKNGVFLVPTRQDAQGVSMCEAMSSGLVPVTLNNTAIPEFVDTDSGFLCNSSEEIEKAIIELNENYNFFSFLSKNAAEKIAEKCGIENTVLLEYQLIINQNLKKEIENI